MAQHDDMLNLVTRFAATGDAEAFSELVTCYQDLVYGTCLRVLGNQADAEDVAQECFLRLSRRAETVRTSVTGWLHHNATTMSIDEQRRQIARKRREEVHSQMKNAENHDPKWQEIAPHVDAALDELPDDLRIPLIEHFLHRRSQADVAKELGLSKATISRRIDTGVAQLRGKLEKAGVTVSVVLLASLLMEHSAAAAPAVLSASLGKIALSGIRAEAAAAVSATCATGGSTAVGAALFGKATIACMIAAVTVLGGVVAHQVGQRQAAEPPPVADRTQQARVPQADMDFRVAIYFVSEPKFTAEAENLRLDELVLEVEPLLTDKDIWGFDWEHQVMRVHRKVLEKLPNQFGIPRFFVIVADGERCYLGSTISAISSYVPKTPLLTRETIANAGDMLFIRPLPTQSYRHNDPRPHPALRRALGELGKFTTIRTEPRHPAQLSLYGPVNQVVKPRRSVTYSFPGGLRRHIDLRFIGRTRYGDDFYRIERTIDANHETERKTVRDIYYNGIPVIVFDDDERAVLQPPDNEGKPVQTVVIEEIRPMMLYAVQHEAVVDSILPTWAWLTDWADRNGRLKPNIQAFGISHLDPFAQSANQVRYEACITIEDEIDTNEDDARILLIQGRYAVITHRGPLEDAPAVTSRLETWLKGNGIAYYGDHVLMRYHDIINAPNDDRFVIDYCIRLMEPGAVNAEHVLVDVETQPAMLDIASGGVIKATTPIRDNRAFQSWLQQEGKGDIGFDDAQGGGLFAARNAELAVLDGVYDWVHAFGFEERDLRTAIDTGGGRVVQLAQFQGKFPIVAAQSHEGHLALLRVLRLNRNGVAIEVRTLPLWGRGVPPKSRLYDITGGSSEWDGSEEELQQHLQRFPHTAAILSYEDWKPKLTGIAGTRFAALENVSDWLEARNLSIGHYEDVLARGGVEAVTLPPHFKRSDRTLYFVVQTGEGSIGLIHIQRDMGEEVSVAGSFRMGHLPEDLQEKVKTAGVSYNDRLQLLDNPARFFGKGIDIDWHSFPYLTARGMPPEAGIDDVLAKQERVHAYTNQDRSELVAVRGTMICPLILPELAQPRLRPTWLNQLEQMSVADVLKQVNNWQQGNPDVNTMPLVIGQTYLIVSPEGKVVVFRTDNHNDPRYIGISMVPAQNIRIQGDDWRKLLE